MARRARFDTSGAWPSLVEVGDSPTASMPMSPNQTGNLWEFAESEIRLDFSSSYHLTKNLELELEALNLLDTPTATKVDIDAERRVLDNHTGRNVLLGARFQY
jgi:outer membrane receptor for monomeric catechols